MMIPQTIEGIEKLIQKADKTTDIHNFSGRLIPVYLPLHAELFKLENKGLYNNSDFWIASGKYLAYVTEKYLNKYDR